MCRGLSLGLGFEFGWFNAFDSESVYGLVSLEWESEGKGEISAWWSFDLRVICIRSPKSGC